MIALIIAISLNIIMHFVVWKWMMKYEARRYDDIIQNADDLRDEFTEEFIRNELKYIENHVSQLRHDLQGESK